MRKLLLTSSFILIVPFAVQAKNLDLTNFNCQGSAEFGKIIINQVKVQNKDVSLIYTINSKTKIQNYVLTERKKNGVTDQNTPAYFIGATRSGDVNDYEDISLPHLGAYKNGIMSEIAFNVEGQRVFGTVECK